MSPIEKAGSSPQNQQKGGRGFEQKETKKTKKTKGIALGRSGSG
jgi:hypothetical protein